MTIADEYARHCVELTADELPDQTVEYAKKLVLDSIGTAIGGYVWSDSAEVMVETAAALGGEAHGGSATVLATGERLPAADAALANGALSHCLDYDNRHSAGALHIGSSVVTAALAAAERAAAPGAAVIEGVVAGYDVAARLGMACNPRSAHDRGFHPTGTCGTFGATAAAGTVLGLGLDELVAAFGVNASQASGSTVYHGSGGWNKRIHPGLAARDAFLALAFARTGFVGPSAPIGGRLGFLEAYANDPRPERATADLGTVFEAERTKIKPYPVGTYAHVPIAIMIDLVETHDLDPASIDEIVVELPTAGADIFARAHDAGHPTASVEAQFDMPFAAAMAVIHGEVTLTAFDDVLAAPYTPPFTAIMEATTTLGSEALDESLPDRYPGRVTIRTSEETYEERREWVHGEPDHPMTWSDLDRKVGELARPLADDARAQLVDRVRHLEDHDSSDVIDCIRA